MRPLTCRAGRLWAKWRDTGRASGLWAQWRKACRASTGRASTGGGSSADRRAGASSGVGAAGEAGATGGQQDGVGCRPSCSGLGCGASASGGQRRRLRRWSLGCRTSWASASGRCCRLGCTASGQQGGVTACSCAASWRDGDLRCHGCTCRQQCPVALVSAALACHNCCISVRCQDARHRGPPRRARQQLAAQLVRGQHWRRVTRRLEARSAPHNNAQLLATALT